MSARRETKVGRGDLARVAAGLLFLQAFFTADRRQAVGFAAALAPLARLWSGEERARFLARHLENFNTNPAMAGPIAGVAVRYEERAAAGDATARERIPRLKRSMEGPLAGVGDAFLWRALRAGGGLFGAAVATVAGAVGPVLFLLLYNAGHLALRIGGVFWGYERGEGIVGILRSRPLQQAVKRADLVIVVALVAIGAGLIIRAPGAPAAGLLGVALAALAALLPDRFRGHGTLWSAGAIMIGLLFAEIFR